MNARVRTCSHACAAGLRKRGKAEAVARLRARRREAQGVKGPMSPEARLGHGRGNQRASVPGPLEERETMTSTAGTATANLSGGARRHRWP